MRITRIGFRECEVDTGFPEGRCNLPAVALWDFSEETTPLAVCEHHDDPIPGRDPHTVRVSDILQELEDTKDYANEVQNLYDDLWEMCLELLASYWEKELGPNLETPSTNYGYVERAHNS